MDDAEREMKRAIELEPLSLNMNAEIGRLLLYQRQYDAAIEQERKTLQMDPEFNIARQILAMAYLQKGRYAEALQTSQALQATNRHSFTMTRAHLRSGNKAAAQKVVSDLLAMSTTRHISANSIAVAYIGLEDTERAFEWLEKAFVDRSDASRLHAGTIRSMTICGPTPDSRICCAAPACRNDRRRWFRSPHSTAEFLPFTAVRCTATPRTICVARKYYAQTALGGSDR